MEIGINCREKTTYRREINTYSREIEAYSREIERYRSEMSIYAQEMTGYSLEMPSSKASEVINCQLTMTYERYLGSSLFSVE